MGREWQQTRQREYVMPDAVYYQSIWAVRDLPRMEDRLKELEREPARLSSGSLVISDGHHRYSAIKPTETKAMEKVMLENRIEAIRNALNNVPERYRGCIMDSVVYRKSHAGYATKIWKMWKQRFLFYVAKNLSLM